VKSTAEKSGINMNQLPLLSVVYKIWFSFLLYLLGKQKKAIIEKYHIPFFANKEEH